MNTYYFKLKQILYCCIIYFSKSRIKYRTIQIFMIVWLKDFKGFITWNLRYLRYNLANTCNCCHVTAVFGSHNTGSHCLATALHCWSLAESAVTHSTSVYRSDSSMRSVPLPWSVLEFEIEHLGRHHLTTCKIYSVFNWKICSRPYILPTLHSQSFNHCVDIVKSFQSTM